MKGVKMVPLGSEATAGGSRGLWVLLTPAWCWMEGTRRMLAEHKLDPKQHFPNKKSTQDIRKNMLRSVILQLVVLSKVLHITDTGESKEHNFKMLTVSRSS